MTFLNMNGLYEMYHFHIIFFLAPMSQCFFIDVSKLFLLRARTEAHNKSTALDAVTK